jgi:hypothetical protein
LSSAERHKVTAVVITAVVTEAFAAFTLLVRSERKAALEHLTCASAEAREKIASSLPAVRAETAERASLTADLAEKAAALLVGVVMTALASILRQGSLVAAVVVGADILAVAAVAPAEDPRSSNRVLRVFECIEVRRTTRATVT